MTGRKLAETVFGSRRENDLIAWRVETGSDGLGWPEVTRQGNLLVADDQGVASIAPDGRIAWRHPREAWTHARPKSTSDGGCVWSPGNGGLVGLDPQGRFQLNKWPQTEREYPRHFRIATQMMRGPATVAEIAEASGVPAADVADFVNANLATGFAEPVVEVPDAADEAPRARGGLLGRLRNR